MRARDRDAGAYPPRKWTEAEDEFIREFAPGRLISEIQAEHERRFGFKRSSSSLQNRKVKLGAKSGIRAGMFKKGFTPWNKGRTWDELGISEESRERIRTTQFKKGGIPHNAKDKPIGYERVDAKDGYIWVKIKDGVQGEANDNFRQKHHVVWEKASGRPVPDGWVIAFADHDRTNCDPDNLVAVPRSLWSVITHEGIEYADRQTLELAVDIAKARRAVHSAKCRPRTCKACGGEFEPRYPNQRTCDTCLGRSDAPQDRV